MITMLKPDPLGQPRNPLAVYLLLLALVSGAGMLAGVTTARNVEDALPHFVAATWGGLLSFGSGATLVGMYWPGAVATGLLWKRVGMFTLTIAAAVYSVVLLVAFGTAGAFQSGTIAGFGAACCVQFARIEQRVKAIIEATP